VTDEKLGERRRTLPLRAAIFSASEALPLAPRTLSIYSFARIGAVVAMKVESSFRLYPLAELRLRKDEVS
jgi:hypothetical protein